MLHIIVHIIFNALLTLLGLSVTDVSASDKENMVLSTRPIDNSPEVSSLDISTENDGFTLVNIASMQPITTSD